MWVTFRLLGVQKQDKKLRKLMSEEDCQMAGNSTTWLIDTCMIDTWVVLCMPGWQISRESCLCGLEYLKQCLCWDLQHITYVICKATPPEPVQLVRPWPECFFRAWLDNGHLLNWSHAKDHCLKNHAHLINWWLSRPAPHQLTFLRCFVPFGPKSTASKGLISGGIVEI